MKKKSIEAHDRLIKQNPRIPRIAKDRRRLPKYRNVRKRRLPKKWIFFYRRTNLQQSVRKEIQILSILEKVFKENKADTQENSIELELLNRS